MLSKTYNEHKFDNEATRARADELKKEALNSVGGVTNSLVECLNGGVSEVFINQRELNFQVTKLSGQSVIFSRHAQKWVSLCENLNQTLNEIGDIDNWANVMDRDVFVITRTVELAKSK